MDAYFNYVGFGFATLLPIVNPVAAAGIFAGLSGQMTPSERIRQVNLIAVYLFTSLLVCFYAGRMIMATFGLSLPGIRLAGGLIVSYMGFTMLFPSSPEALPAGSADKNEARVEVSADVPEVGYIPHGDALRISNATRSTQRLLVPATPGKKAVRTLSTAFVPMTLPVTVGPGAIAVVLSNASAFHGAGAHRLLDHLAVVTVDLGVAIVIWLTLRGSGPLMSRMGESGIQGVGRLVGFMLVCMGVQFSLNGLTEVFAL